MKRIITKLLVAVLAVAGFTMALAPASAYAANDPFCGDNVPEKVRESMGCTDDSLNDANDDFNSTAIGIINAVLGIIGLVAVVFVIYGGVLYITSAGDAGKLQRAKNTILYAIIGLVFVGLAATIVNFVISGILYHQDTSEQQDDNNTQQP